MNHIINLLFESKMLKEIPRSGYHFLGVGKESVAEHSFMITLIAYVMTKMEPEIDSLKLITMCLLHDLPEARIGDLNYVQKNYVTPDEKKAVHDTTQNLPFGGDLTGLINEFNEGRTRESQLARDADQLSFIIDLKALRDIGNPTPDKWLPIILERLKTGTGKALAEGIMSVGWDEWWMKNYVDRPK